MLPEFYGNVESSNIEVHTLTGIIHCHKIILSRNQYFAKLILNSQDKIILHDVFKFDENIIIKYIKYLYDIDEITPMFDTFMNTKRKCIIKDNAIKMLTFLDYVGDHMIKLKAFSLISDPDIDDNIIKLIVKNISFRRIWEYYDIDYDFTDIEIQYIVKRLLNYKYKDLKYEYNFIRSCIFHNHNQEKKLIRNMNPIITALCKTLLCDDDFQKKLIEYNKSKYRPIWLLVSLLREKLVTNVNSYLIQYLLKNQKHVSSKLYKEGNCARVYIFNDYEIVSDPSYFSQLGFTLYQID